MIAQRLPNRLTTRWHLPKATPIAAISFLTACGELTGPGPASHASASTSAPTELVRATYPAEAEQIEVAEQVPGFGGFFIDADRRFHGYVVDPSQTGAASTALRRILDRRRARSRGRLPTEIAVTTASFGFVQLQTWRDVISQADHPAMNAIGIDVAKNTVRVDVQDTVSALEMIRLTSGLGIPDAAVHIRVRSRERDFAGTLRDVQTPHIGGLLITAYSLTRGKPCTLGYNTLGGSYFVTVAHCTVRDGPDAPDDLARAFQPSIDIGPYIGVEYEDPATFSNAEDPTRCPPGARCRWSDAALFAYAASVAPGAAGVAKIERTNFWTTGPFAGPGSIQVSGELTIVAEEDYAWQGLELQKMGQFSGWTAGEVTIPCLNVRGETGILFLCQSIVSGYAGSGDSGAPVFEYLSNHEVTFYGILRGGQSVDYEGFSFSPFGNIVNDLGYLPAIGW